MATMAFDRAGFDREVGLRLQKARRVMSLTQDLVAKRIGILRPTYANFESGRQRIPVDVLWRAAIVLRTSIGALVPEPVTQRGSGKIVAINSSTSRLPSPAYDLSTATSLASLESMANHIHPVGMVSSIATVHSIESKNKLSSCDE